jgi:arginyl-tRNA synthetase
LSKQADQHLDFDIDLAKSDSKENIFYYIQYAHARIFSLEQKYVEMYPGLGTSIEAIEKIFMINATLLFMKYLNIQKLLINLQECFSLI